VKTLVVGAIRSVVFDIGGVLLDWDPRHLYGQLIADPAELDWFLEEVCTMEWNGTIDAGRSFEEACADLAGRFPHHAELVHAWKRQEEMIAGEVAGIAAVVERLRDAGIPLYLLTNMPTEIFVSRLERHPVLRGFDGAVVSGREGVLKPSAEIFERLAARFDLDPASTLFIDDSEANIGGARAAGFVAHHFVDTPTLEAELRTHGLAI
jgi:2-haloacid dehalogenase